MHDLILLELLYGPSPADFDAIAAALGTTRDEVVQVDQGYREGDEDTLDVTDEEWNATLRRKGIR